MCGHKLEYDMSYHARLLKSIEKGGCISNTKARLYYHNEIARLPQSTHGAIVMMFLIAEQKPVGTRSRRKALYNCSGGNLM